MVYRKKLIEVALPLEAINMESAREKSIRHGHPSTLHLWWARRPLAACRAVLFASLVDDPSSWPERFPTEEAQNAERQRIFDILGKIVTVEEKGKTKQVVRGLVSWNDINDPNSGVLIAAQREIARSIAWNRGEEPPKEPEAVRHYLAENAPPVYDPFCGGGSIPLEAQRLGLEAHASDLNPVAVLITKALIEIPPKFKDMPPVNPEARQEILDLGFEISCSEGKQNNPKSRVKNSQSKTSNQKSQIKNPKSYWQGAQGLAEDVRYYGKWMRDEAEKQIGHLYPKVKAIRQPDGSYKAYEGDESIELDSPNLKVEELTVIAWLWARTVKCPNPACECQMPLVRSFEFSTKKGRETWGNPIINRSQTPPKIKFEVKTGKDNIPKSPKTGRGAAFNCLACGQPAGDKHIKAEGVAGRMNTQLMAIVAEGLNGRIYLSPTSEHEEIARKVELIEYPDGQISEDRRSMFTPLYGLTHFYHLFTSRQLVALTTFSDLVSEARTQAIADALAVGVTDDDVSLNDGGTGARAYGDAIATYLGLALGKATDTNSSLCSWQNRMDRLSHVFTRQALPMVWDFAEPNSFGGASGDLLGAVKSLCEVLDKLEEGSPGQAFQKDAAAQEKYHEFSKIISTDPPYYDNVGYADLSDYFYIWHRRSLQFIYPHLFITLLVPKAQELVATPYRFAGSKQKAQAFFEEGLGRAFNKMYKTSRRDYPITIYYAFKQTETEQREKNDELIASTGWETMLEGLIKAYFSIGGTWPLRSELNNRMIASGTNALASSIVLVCRPRPDDAPSTTRRRFVDELKSELPDALKKLQQGNIAPVDLAQASIGPGMAIFSRYTKVLESDGSPMRIRTALQLINQTLDEFLTEQEGEFDRDTRWALAWFEQYQFNEGQFGDAETLSKAKNTSIKGMVDAGILTAKAGKVQLVPRTALPADWNPAKDNRIPVWEATQHLIQELDCNGETGAARLLSQLGNLGEAARDLAYRLYSICDRKGWTQEAIAYNSLVISWSEIARLAIENAQSQPVQGELLI